METITIKAAALLANDAMMRERDRCAAIADAQAANMKTDAAVMACEKIAIDIRNGPGWADVPNSTPLP